jgi:hypothetical protein
VEGLAGTLQGGGRAIPQDGRSCAEGLKTLGRWHTAGSSRGFHLVEGSDAALAEINAVWADLLELEAVPVVEDDVAGQVATNNYGKRLVTVMRPTPAADAAGR